MAITRTAIIDDDGSGKTGTVIDNAWKQELYNQIDGALVAAAGTWQAVTLAGGVSSETTGATLATAIVTNRMIRVAPTVILWMVRFDSLSVEASTASVILNYPQVGATPFSVANINQINPVTYSTPSLGGLYMQPLAVNRFKIRKNDFTNMAAGAYYLAFSAILEAAP
jgi:hypothetical protein